MTKRSEFTRAVRGQRYVHAKGHCERCGTELVGRVSDEIAKARAEGAAGARAPALGRSPEYRLDVPAKCWKRLRNFVWEQAGPLCRYCGENAGLDWCCDHVVPVARGGRSELSNLVVSCRPCNASKKDRLISEWVRT